MDIFMGFVLIVHIASLEIYLKNQPERSMGIGRFDFLVTRCVRFSSKDLIFSGFL